MNGILTLYLDQFGNHWFARTTRELQRKIGGRISKMYKDKMDESISHIGYVVGKHWCDAYHPFEHKES